LIQPSGGRTSTRGECEEEEEKEEREERREEEE